MNEQPIMPSYENGIRQIDEARWERIRDTNYPDMDMGWQLTVTDSHGRPCQCYLSLRPNYCDRGHIQFHLDAYLNLDHADSFPRYFFSQQEANKHVREFLKWRIWKYRTHPHILSFD